MSVTPPPSPPVTPHPPYSDGEKCARIRINMPKIISSATSAVDYVSTLGVTQCEPRQINLTKKKIIISLIIRKTITPNQLKTVDFDRALRYLPGDRCNQNWPENVLYWDVWTSVPNGFPVQGTGSAEIEKSTHFSQIIEVLV